jgi:hypothetical protein
VKINKTAERPAIQLWIRDSNNALIDFSSGYTFTFKIGYKGRTALLTKTTGIVGAAGAGAEPSGQLTATTGGLDRIYPFPVEIVDVVL